MKLEKLLSLKCLGSSPGEFVQVLNNEALPSITPRNDRIGFWVVHHLKCLVQETTTTSTISSFTFSNSAAGFSRTVEEEEEDDLVKVYAFGKSHRLFLLLFSVQSLILWHNQARS
ncbi:hypothetical protein ACFX2I_042455 [Malus domestica]